MSVLHFDFYRFNFDTSNHSTGIKFRPLESFEGARGIKSDTSGGHFHGSQVSNMNHSYLTTTRPNHIQEPKQRAGQFAEVTGPALPDSFPAGTQPEPRLELGFWYHSGIAHDKSGVLAINGDSWTVRRTFSEHYSGECSPHCVRKLSESLRTQCGLIGESLSGSLRQSLYRMVERKTREAA